MAITRGYCQSFIDELTEGVHNLDTDVIKIALYTDSASLSPSTTTAYSATNEVSGTGYSSGGKTFSLTSGFPAQSASTGQKSYRFDDVTWTSASFTARGALIYNSSQSNKAIMILDFGGNRTVTSSTFTVSNPTTVPPLIALR
jgi:hypothetical protein